MNAFTLYGLEGAVLRFSLTVRAASVGQAVEKLLRLMADVPPPECDVALLVVRTGARRHVFIHDGSPTSKTMAAAYAPADTSADRIGKYLEACGLGITDEAPTA